MEPGASAVDEKSQAKANRYLPMLFSALLHRGAFLSQAGPRARLCFLTLSITSLKSRKPGLETTKATSSGRPRSSHIWLYDELNAAPYEGRRRDPHAACEHHLAARPVEDDRQGGFGAGCVVEDESGHSSSPCRGGA